MKTEYFYYKVNGHIVYDQSCEDVGDIKKCLEEAFEDFLGFSKARFEDLDMKDFMWNYASLLKEYKIVKIGMFEFGLTLMSEEEYKTLEESCGF